MGELNITKVKVEHVTLLLVDLVAEALREAESTSLLDALFKSLNAVRQYE